MFEKRKKSLPMQSKSLTKPSSASVWSFLQQKKKDAPKIRRLRRKLRAERLVAPWGPADISAAMQDGLNWGMIDCPLRPIPPPDRDKKGTFEAACGR